MVKWDISQQMVTIYYSCSAGRVLNKPYTVRLHLKKDKVLRTSFSPRCFCHPWHWILELLPGIARWGLAG